MPSTITARELRANYIAFFAARGHAAIPSASLVPANDPSALFTMAGMHPLAPYLLGEPHPAGRRLVDVQKCVRTGDIDAVGDDSHLTWFEMLGNWSLGDYGREASIGWSFEFLTEVLGLPRERLAVTCFAGDDAVREDAASVAAWRRLGMPAARIARLGRDDNWWGPVGATGPCGPDTEIFYWVDGGRPPDGFDPRDRRWVEIWNNVFMSHMRTADGDTVALPRISVDTGMGLERALVALNGLGSVYEVDTMRPLLDELRGLATAAAPRERELRVVADHVRAACFVIADGVAPGNKDRGYVLRRLVRRCMVFARGLGLPRDWYARAAATVSAMLGDEYPELARGREAIVATIGDEAARFERTLAHGLRVLEQRAVLDGAAAFDLLQTYGFPFELTRELGQAAGKPIDEEGFRRELEAHRARSRPGPGAAATFRGGLADDPAEVIVRYHTVTHLLQAALRELLGGHVIQRGSNITRDRLRFDFSHDGRVLPDELARVAARVTGWLARDLVVERAAMSEPAARALGAIGAFGEKYGDVVSVYSIADRATGEVVSREFCGGPHVRSLDELRGRRFQIAREQAVAAGIRRIKAVLV